MQYAHDQGITHRDIKPHNLLLSEDSDSDEVSIKILDMGLARFDSLLGDDPDAAAHAAMTNTGVIMGTVDYMSPEQALRSRDADNRSDIYSLGCTLHFLLTGRPVFEGDTIMTRLIAHREVPVPSIEQHCNGGMRGLDAVFHRMLAKKPDRRYQSMREVAADINALLTGRVPVAVKICPGAEGSILEQRRRRRRRPAYTTWVGILGVVCLIGGGIWAALDTKQPVFQPEASFAATGLPFPVNFGGGNRLLDGGDGKSVAVLPVGHFHDDEYTELKRQLDELNIQLVVATIRGQQPHPKHDESLHVETPVPLTTIRPDDFDMIYFIGGSTAEFQSKAATQTLQPLLNTAIGQGLVLAAPSQSVLQEVVGVDFYSQFTTARDGDVTSGRPSGLAGWIVHGESAVQTRALVRKAKQLCEETADRRRFGMSSGGRIATRFNGFPGRALVILPDGFDEGEFRQLATVLGNQAIGFEVASSRWGEICSNDKSVSRIADRMLDEFAPRNYDFVFFVGGNTHEFTKSEANKRLKRLAVQGLEAGLILIATSAGGQELIEIADACAGCTFEKVDQITVGQPKNKPGAIVTVQSPKHMKTMLIKVVAVRDKVIDRLQAE